MKSLIIKEIIREYEHDRLRADNLLSAKRDEIYEKIPRVREIDKILSETSIQISKKILSDNSELDTLIYYLKTKNEDLIKEKNQLLHKNGYIDDSFAYKCKICKDTGYVGNKKCRCFSQKMIDKFYEFSNLKNVLNKQNFSNFKLDYFPTDISDDRGISSRKNMEYIYKRSIYFIDNFKKLSINILMTGEPGLGKTFLCSCIAKEVMDKGYTVLYLTSAQLFKQVEKARFDDSSKKISNDYINMLYDVDLLIMDDMGTEFSTSVTDAEFFNIVNTRIMEERSTIISTNLNLKNFGDHYTKRVVSRLVGSYEQWYFFGRDIRRTIKFG